MPQRGNGYVPLPRPVGNRQRTEVGHWANCSCRQFIIVILPLMRHGVRLSTASLYDLQGALTRET